jgi:hypothetical protein
MATGQDTGCAAHDATDERFVFTVGAVVDGWRGVAVATRQVAHYLGSSDGVIDTPIRTVAVELGRWRGP